MVKLNFSYCFYSKGCFDRIWSFFNSMICIAECPTGVNCQKRSLVSVDVLCIWCLIIHGTHVITNNSTENVFFFASVLKIVYYNKYQFLITTPWTREKNILRLLFRVKIIQNCASIISVRFVFLSFYSFNCFFFLYFLITLFWLFYCLLYLKDIFRFLSIYLYLYIHTYIHIYIYIYIYI